VKDVASLRPEHNNSLPLGRKAAITVQLGLVAPKVAVRQLPYRRDLHRLNEALSPSRSAVAVCRLMVEFTFSLQTDC
jgi:hypothetical protein